MFQKKQDKKRTLEGTDLDSHNSFVVLNNEDICDIAGDMGISICVNDFDITDMMKDLEVARHSLKDKVDNGNKMVVEVTTMMIIKKTRTLMICFC